MTARFKVSVIAGSPQRMGEAVAALTSLHFQTTITEVMEVAAAPRQIPITTNEGTKSPTAQKIAIRRGKPKQVRVAGGAKPSNTARGKVILSVINTKRVARWADVRKALKAAGYSASGDIMKQLVAEGRAVREGYGLYRQPSTTETLHQQQVKDPTFTAT